MYERSLLLTHDPGQQKAIYQRWNLNASLFSMTMPKKRESGNKNIAAAVFRQTSVGVFRARCYTNLKKKNAGTSRTVELLDLETDMVRSHFRGFRST